MSMVTREIPPNRRNAGDPWRVPRSPSCQTKKIRDIIPPHLNCARTSNWREWTSGFASYRDCRSPNNQKEVKPFTDKQTQLVDIFANQALIEPLSGEWRRTGVHLTRAWR